MTHTILGELSDGLGPNHRQSHFSFWVLRQKPTNRCDSRIFEVSISQFLIVSCKSMNFQNMTHTILGELAMVWGQTIANLIFHFGFFARNLQIVVRVAFLKCPSLSF